MAISGAQMISASRRVSVADSASRHGMWLIPPRTRLGLGVLNPQEGDNPYHPPPPIPHSIGIPATLIKRHHLDQGVVTAQTGNFPKRPALPPKPKPQRCHKRAQPPNQQRTAAANSRSHSSAQSAPDRLPKPEAPLPLRQAVKPFFPQCRARLRINP